MRAMRSGKAKPRPEALMEAMCYCCGGHARVRLSEYLAAIARDDFPEGLCADCEQKIAAWEAQE